MINWSEWYVRHLQGNGFRVKVKSTENAVHGGAGSVSQMISGYANLEFQLGRIDGISVIRFSGKFRRKHKYLMKLALSLKEYQENILVLKPGQTTLEDW